MTVLYDTLTRSPREVTASPDGVLRFYVCGPTIHDYGHVGNFRTFTFTDIARRVLEQRGHDVRFVMNITDVEDKIIQRANDAGLDVRDPARLPDYTRKYEDAFLADCATLRIKKADEHPRATEHVAGMIELVSKLIEKGHAYESEGSVYFEVASLESYGKLSGCTADSTRAGARVDCDEYDKEDARDFVLWKASKDGEPVWDSPWGGGRPGWHLECSVMSTKSLGSNTLDLHAGGEDLVFPHHENEIAQSEGAHGGTYCKHWIHSAHLRVDGQKMSKSLGNFYTLRDLVEKGHDPLAIRYLLASVHYRAPLNLTDDALEAAGKAVERLNEFSRRVVAAKPAGAGEDDELADLVEKHSAEFDANLDDDLCTSGALGALFSVVREVNPAIEKNEASERTLNASRELLEKFDAIFACLKDGMEAKSVVREIAGKSFEATALGDVPQEILEKVVARAEARAAKDYAAADTLRDEVAGAGFVVEDTRDGARVKAG
ncbi:MAG: cysteine--tRNA ligase [Acidobacteriota bacterium]